MVSDEGEAGNGRRHGEVTSREPTSEEEALEENVQQALRQKDPDEEVEDALGAPPQSPGPSEQEQAGGQPGEPPD